MSSDVSRPNPPDVHSIWYSPPQLSVEIAQYLLSIFNHFSTVGAIAGPDDWYVSQVEVYKNRTGFRHELLLATVQQTPRTRPQQDSSSAGHQEVISTEARQDRPNPIPSQPQATGYLIIERRVNGRRPKEGASESGPANPGEQTRESSEDGDSSSFDDSVIGKWRGKKSAVQFLSGKKPALDEVRHKLAKGEMGKAELIGRMDLPQPAALPHEDDSDTIFEELLAKVQSQQTTAASTALSSSSPPTAFSSSSSRRFVSLLALLCLADTVTKEETYYSITSNNCYWYCSTILYSLRRYTHGTIILPLEKGGIVSILPGDSNDAIKAKFVEAKSRFGRFGFLDIVTPPEPERIDGILREWEVNRTQTENSCDRNRLQTLQKERDVVARKNAETLDELDRTRKKLQAAEDALAKHGIHMT
ncbi:hypothetical protein Agabi119p4_10377 [Agaricus bisporus var. burnettii]|uniref:Uncharacterized protein n=1 Tax=Agaricus bisporus var. burnettii TaxID=192524 RepID=A0A8H7C2S2_AGABI|nr:hypothetical protein Agabi119p4_10377 [Agaricus bisporus var. burnettii]